MAQTSRQKTGRSGESLAADYLTQKGYHILARNVRTAYGEIDLIVIQDLAKSLSAQNSNDTVMVFVEVKTRRTKKFGYPEEAVTGKKLAHMQAAAQAYLQGHPEFVGDWRLDVIAIRMQGNRDVNTEIVHFENILP